MPIVEKQSYGNEEDTPGCSEELRYSVRENMLYLRAIFHNGRGKIREISLAKERQRQLAKFLGQGYTTLGTLGINLCIGRGILPKSNNKDYKEAKQTYEDIVAQAMGGSSPGVY